MKITDILKTKKTFSFEVFPPKAEQPLEPLLNALNKLYAFEPDFISCTYGAGGGNKDRSKTICEAVLKDEHTAMAHFTCIGNTKADIKSIIGEYAALGIENILALRGDFPKGHAGTGGDFDHADALIRFLKREFPDMCLAAAGYPEKHILAQDFASDIARLRGKQDAGADFIMTQLCHDVDAYERFAEHVRAAGVRLPLIVGLMPVLAKDAIIRMTLSNGCSIPREMAAIIGKYGDDPESFKKAGIEYTRNLIRRFMESGVDGIHIYTLNKSEDVAAIVGALNIKRREHGSV